MLKTLAKTYGLMIGLSEIKMAQADKCTDLGHDGKDLCTYKHGPHTEIIRDDLDDVYVVSSRQAIVLIDEEVKKKDCSSCGADRINWHTIPTNRRDDDNFWEENEKAGRTDD